MTATTKTVHLFDPVTKEYRGPYEAQANPLEEGEFIKPDASLDDAPPTAGTNQVAVAQDGQWVLMDDFRQAPAFSTADGSPVQIEAIGPLPPTATLLPRPIASKWENGAWVEDFTIASKAQLAQFRADRRAMFALIGDMGFVALATGDTATKDALLVFRQGVADLPAWPAVLSATTSTELKTALSTRYKALTNALPASVKLMFKELAS